MRVGKFMWTLCWYSTRINCSLLSLLNYLPFHCSWHWYIYVYIYIYMKNVKVLAAQLCLTICSPMDCSPLGSSVHGIQLEWVAMPFSKGSSQPRNRTQVSCIAGRFFTIWGIRKAYIYIYIYIYIYASLVHKIVLSTFSICWLSWND